MRIAILGTGYFFAFVIPKQAFAHVGVHHHPHGVEYGWIIACAVGICGGFAVSFVKSRRK